MGKGETVRFGRHGSRFKEQLLKTLKESRIEVMVDIRRLANVEA